MFQELPETLPDWLVKQSDFMSYAEAAYQLHWPENQTKLAEAKDRIGFEEVFAYALAGQLNKKQVEAEIALQIEFDQTFAKKYIGALPFDLTAQQKKAAWEILQDIDKETPMNRLLEGDVGAGKTVVAAMAANIS